MEIRENKQIKVTFTFKELLDKLGLQGELEFITVRWDKETVRIDVNQNEEEPDN